MQDHPSDSNRTSTASIQGRAPPGPARASRGPAAARPCRRDSGGHDVSEAQGQGTLGRIKARVFVDRGRGDVCACRVPRDMSASSGALAIRPETSR